jgi:hypothetical protein
MSITVYTYGTGDFGLHGVDSGQTTMADNYANAYAAIQVDTWANDAYALKPAGIFLQPWWNGNGHLLKKSSGGHLLKDAGGHLRKKFAYWPTGGSAECVAVADACSIAGDYLGTVVTSVKCTLQTIFENVLNVPAGETYWLGTISFYTTATLAPASDWGWLGGTPGATIIVGSSYGPYDVTFTLGGSVTLNNWFWVVYGLSTYATMPTYDVSNLTSRGTIPDGSQVWSKDVKVQFGLANTYVLNP